jgi:hypothetical protein
MTLIDTEMIDAQFIEDQAVVFFLLGEEVFEALLTPGFLLLQIFEDVAVCAGRLGGCTVAQQLVVRGDLLPQKALLVRLGCQRLRRNVPKRAR